ncbi:hypothetical protein [Alkalicoccobacillus murimartini]|uniref:Uncharacterized protein n=1 Tax=Alkalicoccobacillus murimartini TaxID=171685 RepID=A0ABT9YEB7_9BACI|nr:hypothetical protein [Alkalicoccobacillus murimartini]MDQ0206178.1 hypothetical protein [Alkalicoccobacillus murimartini]
MEQSLQMHASNSPCLVIVDTVNGRYAIRTEDTSGRTFSNGADVLDWIKHSWQKELFVHPSEYDKLLKAIESELTSS